MSDRLAGLALALLSIAYLRAGAGYEAGFGDPLGPAAFTQLIGWPALALSLALALWPGAPARWARGAALARQGAALLVLAAYAWGLEPLGFVPATFLAVTALALLMGARWLPALATAAAVAPGLYLLFDRAMGLPLPLVGDLLS